MSERDTILTPPVLAQRVPDLEAARLIARGLTESEAEFMLQACLERVRPTPVRVAEFTMLPDGRLARVMPSPSVPITSPGRDPGLVAWWEHEAAWTNYAARHGRHQSAARIEERGGFSYAELEFHLGRPPITWRPRL